VPGARFELARVSPYAPQTYVSTNSTTRARVFLLCAAPRGAAAYLPPPEGGVAGGVVGWAGLCDGACCAGG
jgi:hypothetical protein